MITLKPNKFGKTKNLTFDDIFSFIEFIKNPDAISDQLRQLSDIADKANAAIEGYESLEQIKEMEAHASHAVDEANNMLAQAKSDAIRIVEEARKRAESMQETAEAGIKKAVRDAEYLQLQAIEAMKHADGKLEIANKRHQEVEKIAKINEQNMHDLEVREREIKRAENLLQQLKRPGDV